MFCCVTPNNSAILCYDSQLVIFSYNDTPEEMEEEEIGKDFKI